VAQAAEKPIASMAAELQGSAAQLRAHAAGAESRSYGSALSRSYGSGWLDSSLHAEGDLVTHRALVIAIAAAPP
jgi:hypothetical protein